MDSLFDQSALIALAERLIKAARAAGADSADAVAMRSVSQSVDVRDGAVEESQRSEGDDMGLRVLIGRKQAVVSTNDMSGDGVDGAGRARGGDGARRARGQVCGPRRSGAAGENLPRSRPGRPRTAGCRRARGDGAPRRRGRSRGEGRQQVGRRLGLGRHRRHGAADQPRLLRRLSRLAPLHLDAGDRRRRHVDGDRLRLLLGAACLRSRCAGEDRAERRREGRGAAQSAQGFDQEGAGGVRFPRLRLDRRPSGQRHQRRVDRAQDELPQGQDGRADFRAAASTSSTIRCAAAACARGRSTPRASPANAWR